MPPTSPRSRLLLKELRLKLLSRMELISALAANDWTSVPFVADFDRTSGLEKLGCNSDVLSETDFMGFNNRVTVQNCESRDYRKLLVNTDTLSWPFPTRTFTDCREIYFHKMENGSFSL